MFGLSLGLDKPYHLLVYVLTVDTPNHSRLRCYQRAALASFGVKPGGHLRVDALRTVQVVYVLHDKGDAASAESRREAASLGDVVALPTSQTCLGKVIAALRHLQRSGARYDGVLFSDDDALLHPQRLTHDMAEYASASHLVMGIVSWGGYWDERNQKHVGYANRPVEVATTLLDKWQKASPAQEWQGPFPFPNGFHMGLSRGTVDAMVRALDTTPKLRRLQSYLQTKPPTVKCDPEPDSGLGYILANVAAETPLTTVDLTSAQRVHFWKTRTTADALGKGLSIMHAAKNWTDHFSWAACVLSGLNSAPGRRAANLTSRGHHCTKGFPPLARACKDSRRCPSHYDPILGQHRTWCSASESPQHARRRPPLVAIPPSVCSSAAPVCNYVVERRTGVGEAEEPRSGKAGRAVRRRPG